MAMQRDIFFSVDPRQQRAIERLLTEFPKDADRALARAIDRAGDKVKTLTLRAITRALNIRRKDLTTRHYFGLDGGSKPAVVLERRRRGRDRIAEVRISTRRIPVVWFKARQVYRTPRGKLSRSQVSWRKGWFSTRQPAGIQWKIDRGGSWKHAPSAFFARGRRGSSPGGGGTVATLGSSGHVGVFVRWPPSVKRLPIAQLHGPSIGQEAKHNADLEQALSARGEVRATLTKRLEHELQRLLEKHGAKPRGSRRGAA